jgi:hypothetical protein
MPLRRAELPQGDHRPGLATERSAGEIRGLYVVVFIGEDQFYMKAKAEKQQVLTGRLNRVVTESRGISATGQ